MNVVAAKGVEVGIQMIHLPAQGTAKDMMTEWTSIIATHGLSPGLSLAKGSFRGGVKGYGMSYGPWRTLGNN